MRAAARYGILTALALSAPSIANAGDVDVARKTFAEGVKLYQRGDYEGARRMFRDADKEHHAPAIVYNLGLAEEKLGHVQAAVDAFESYVAEVGDKGELAPAAAIAIAQIKSRATRLRIETTPSGARLFVDGSALKDTAPTAHLVLAGHHVVVAQGEGWSEEKDVEARGGGDTLTVTITAATKPQQAKPPESTAPPPPPPPPAEVPEDFVFGAGFAIIPCYLLGTTDPSKENAAPGFSILAGGQFEAGWALSERFELLARGVLAIGPDGKPSYGYWGGPAVSFRVAEPFWLGASFLGGQIATRINGKEYDTDQVFGASFEVSYAILKKPRGQWLVGFTPGVLVTARINDNTTFFFPFSIGYRGF